MNITFYNLTFDDKDGNLYEYSIKWVDGEGPHAPIEFENRTLYMSHDCTDIVIMHEALHILFDYFRYMESITTLYPFDCIKTKVSAWDEENIISFWTDIVCTLFYIVKNKKYDLKPFETTIPNPMEFLDLIKEGM